MHFSAIPDDAMASLNDESIRIDAADPDKRLPAEVTDGMVQDDGDFYDGEREGDDRRNESDAKRAAEEEGDEGTSEKRPRVE